MGARLDGLGTGAVHGELLQVEHEEERFVDALPLLQREEAGWLGEPVQVDGGDLVAHDQGAALQSGQCLR